jgi:hypothetical protein
MPVEQVQWAVPPGSCGGGHALADSRPATVRLIYRDPISDAVLATEDVCQACADGIARPWASQSAPLIRR